MATPRKFIMFVGVVVIFTVWNIIVYNVISSKMTQNQSRHLNYLWRHMDTIQSEIDESKHMVVVLQKAMMKHQQKYHPDDPGGGLNGPPVHSGPVAKPSPAEVVVAQDPEGGFGHSMIEDRLIAGPHLVPVDYSSLIIPILIISCNRPTVQRCIDSIISQRPSATQFPIIVSQDCNDRATANVIDSYDEVMHIKQPDLSDIKEASPAMKGYYKISRHYKWALTQVFDVYNYGSVIIVEDDLEVSPDFLEFMLASYSLISQDKSLWCASAWNDNGKPSLIDESMSDTLYRTDFFPGLGWMILKSTWNDLRGKWPPAYWDDWMRLPAQRKGQACVRPEISRTSTFGKIGVSKGQFFNSHLKYIKKYDGLVPFSQMDLSYLLKDNYDSSYVEHVYSLSPITLSQLEKHDGSTPVRILYDNDRMFEKIARKLDLMQDSKSGVPRTAYRGIVTCVYKGRRVYITPSRGWSGYNE